ncbi:MAG: dUTP diphosphatase [Hyphomicrobiales bacterium]|nr:dUTP diphosphatase [Hyphomicrobiales bacterium]
MTQLPRLRIHVLPHGEGLPPPAYQTPGAAGFDLCAAVPADAPLAIPPGAWRAVPCGFAMALPPGHEAQIRPRSGLALRHGLTVLNAPGTIDEDYRGEVVALLINHGPTAYVIERGARIAQMVIQPVVRVSFETTNALPQSTRGAGGFGSTGG